MTLLALRTYRNLEELRRIQKEISPTPFIFGETSDVLQRYPKACIDISTLIYILRVDRSRQYDAYLSMRGASQDTIFILKESLAKDAIDFFPYLFSDSEEYFKAECNSEKRNRRPIYCYDEGMLTNVISYANENNISIVTPSRIFNGTEDELDMTDNSWIDLTSVSYALENNKSLIFLAESILDHSPSSKVIALASRANNLLHHFPLYLEGQESMCDLAPKIIKVPKIESEKIRKVVDLSNTDLGLLVEQFDHRLIGHKNFKEHLKSAIKNFIMLNKANKQKIFSVFLFGASGIGKTKAAQVLADSLLDGSHPVKINFGNYSSQDALNNLIGSPRGYIGCDQGELSKKVSTSKVGVLLCDEFEKAARPVFSFFLELLEDGRFTDSMAQEHDLNGYIIVFTSNILSEVEFKKVIPAELQTRFDLVCEFEEPSSGEKREFVRQLLENAQVEKLYQPNPGETLDAKVDEICDSGCLDIHSLRDIEKVFNRHLADWSVHGSDSNNPTNEK